ncbi:hypothetical protein [Sphingomonas radiodurans]|uniref:hypothetical protein n=1 Tax=Sphingomonas radiodurans TaxID=2890321 RepID=UPI001E34205B|nr:hypothetical protein [Sphingomonas radiodurans]WBH17156.1 hypothetical protein LLW23_03280 [Sphingomonas radiodurans]
MAVNGGRDRDDVVGYNLSQFASINRDLGAGYDVVNIDDTAGSVRQVRITFTSTEVGNNVATDSGTLANQDGGLAVRMQAEDDSGALTGGVARFDDEGISFIATGRTGTSAFS